MTGAPRIVLYELPALGPDLARWFIHRDRVVEASKRHGESFNLLSDGERIARPDQAVEWAAGDPLATAFIWALFDGDQRVVAHSALAFTARRHAELDGWSMREWTGELALGLPSREGRTGWFAVYEGRPRVIASNWFPDRGAAANAASQAMLLLSVASVVKEIRRPGGTAGVP